MAAIPPPSSTSSPSDNGVTGLRLPFAIMTVLFFMWGFMTVWNDILIPRFKEAFELTYFQAMLVQFAFFGAYFVGALIFYIISVFSGDPINRIGYKNGVILGLLIAAGGSALFYRAAVMGSYVFFLIALFVVGLGFAMLQIAANPYVTILGPERTASSRLNLSQAFNSLGSTIGPIIGGWLIFQFFDKGGDAHGADSVKIPYLCFAGVFVVLAVAFKFARLPNFTNTENMSRGAGALKVPHTVLGMIAIFMYVGGEVTVGSAVIIGLLIIGMVAEGDLAKWSVLGVGLFCSVMWSNIFALAIEGLGPLKSQASSLLVMAILGVAILPPIQGAVADKMGIQFSFIVPIIAFTYVAFYGIKGCRIGRTT